MFSSRFQNIPIFKNRLQGTSLVVQRFIAGNMDAIPGQGSKFPHAIQCGRKRKKKKRKTDCIFRAVSGSPQNGSGRCRVCTGAHMHSLPQEQHPHQRACLLWLTTQSPELHGGSLLGTYPTLSGQIMTRTHHYSTTQHRFTVLPPSTPTQALTTTISFLSPSLCHFHDVTRWFLQ